MANPYVQAQILAMQQTVRNCRESCRQAIKEGGPLTAPVEAKRMKALDAATSRFLKDLDKIK